jgi:hypothetical protein
MEQFSASSVQLSPKAPASLRNTIQSTSAVNVWFLPECAPNLSACLHATIPRRRYTCLCYAASATQGRSRQTDFKAPALQRMARICHALLLLSVTAAQRFTGSGKGYEKLRLQPFRPGHRGATICSASARPQRCLPLNRRRRPRRACDRASSGRSSTGVRPRTSGRDNAKSRSG